MKVNEVEVVEIIEQINKLKEITISRFEQIYKKVVDFELNVNKLIFNSLIDIYFFCDINSQTFDDYESQLEDFIDYKINSFHNDFKESAYCNEIKTKIESFQTNETVENPNCEINTLNNIIFNNLVFYLDLKTLSQWLSETTFEDACKIIKCADTQSRFFLLSSIQSMKGYNKFMRRLVVMDDITKEQKDEIVTKMLHDLIKWLNTNNISLPFVDTNKYFMPKELSDKSNNYRKFSRNAFKSMTSKQKMEFYFKKIQPAYDVDKYIDLHGRFAEFTFDFLKNLFTRTSQNNYINMYFDDTFSYLKENMCVVDNIASSSSSSCVFLNIVIHNLSKICDQETIKKILDAYYRKNSKMCDYLVLNSDFYFIRQYINKRNDCLQKIKMYLANKTMIIIDKITEVFDTAIEYIKKDANCSNDIYKLLTKYFDNETFLHLIDDNPLFNDIMMFLKSNNSIHPLYIYEFVEKKSKFVAEKYMWRGKIFTLDEMLLLDDEIWQQLIVAHKSIDFVLAFKGERDFYKKKFYKNTTKLRRRIFDESNKLLGRQYLDTVEKAVCNIGETLWALQEKNDFYIKKHKN